MTNIQEKWLRDNGFDPAKYDMEPNGQVIERPPQEPISGAKAFGASFLKNIGPTAAAIAAGAGIGGLEGLAGGPAAPITVPLASIAGGLAAGYGVGWGQDKAIQKFAPGAAEYLQRAEEQHPVASYLGGFAPNALALKPSLSGLRGLANPAMGLKTSPAFMKAAANVGANVAGSTAGQLVNMSQGGEFSPGRFAADVALGSLFNEPTKLGSRLGLHSNPAAPAAEKFNLHESQVNQAFDNALASGERSVPEPRTEVPVAEESRESYTDDPEKYTKWWTDKAAPTEKLIANAAKSVKMKLSPERIAEIANEPYANEIIAGNYENWPDFLADQAEKALTSALNSGKLNEAVFRPSDEGYGEHSETPVFNKKTKKFEKYDARPPRFEDQPERYPVLTAEEVASKRFEMTPERQAQLDKIKANREADAKAQASRAIENERVAAAESTRKAAFRKQTEDAELAATMNAQRERAANLRSIAEGKAEELRRLTQMSRPQLDAPVTRELAPRNEAQLGRENWLKASPEEQAAVAENARKLDEQAQAAEAEKQAKLPDLEAAQALVDEAADRRAAAELKQEELEQLAKKLRLPRAMMDDVVSGRSTLQEAYKAEATAREMRDELYARFQNKSDGTPLTQEALDAIAKIAAKRGLKIELGPIDAANGQWRIDKDGNAVMRLDPLHARIDTAAEELGHDVFNRSATGRMQKSLTEAVQDSPAYEAELARRMKDVEAGKMTQQKAEDIAREEGFMAVFREKFPQVSKAEMASWWKAFKASMKSMAGMKLSPEDAMSWMYYATHEHTPWNAHAANGVVATGEKRNQKGDYIAAMEKARQRRLDIKDVDWDALTAGKPLTIDDIFGNTAAMSRMHFEKPKLIEHGDIELLGVEPRAGLVSREGAFGRAITTGSKNEGTILIDKALWNEAVRGDKASRELFLKVLKHEMGHVDDGANVYDRSPTEQERVADEFEARYQPRALLAGELDKLASKGTPHALAADAYKAGYNTRDAYLGSLRERFNEVNKLSPEDRLKLDAHMQKENDSKILQTPEPEIADAYKQLRGTFYPSVPADYNREGFMIRTAAGGARARGTDPTYSAEHTISDDVKRIFRTPEGEPKRQALYDDFINHYSKLYAADNPSKTAAEVLAYAEGKYQEEMKIMRGESDAGDAHFAGAIKPQGYSLPPSWRSNDLLAKLDNYARRTATDFAYQKHIESNPNLMASLGSKSYKNGIAIPDAILRANQHQQIILDPSMQSVIREFNGQPARPNDSAMAGATRLVGVGAIGPISKPKDVVATTFKGLSYLQPTDYAAGVADFVGRLANWGELRQRSYESGLNRRDAAAQMKTVLGSADELSNWMTKSAEKISKYTGLNQLESAARTIAQGWGETIVGLTKTRALSGDVKSAEFLDKLSKDWRSRTDADLAAQVGRLLQGTYDMRTLPAWALEGPAAPFLTWSKWSIGQYNNFKKFAIEPAMKGDVAPLIGQMVIGVAGGSAVQAVADWMNNRENKDINWSELSSWVDQNQGQLGKDGVELLGQKLLTLAQNLGTFGFAGDLAKTLVDSVSGGGQGVGTMPVYDAAIDTGKRTMAALKAIDNGEDFGRVLRQLVVDLGKGHFQVARAASNWIDTDSNLEYNDKRRRRLYDELSGTPQAGNAFAVSYDNLTERDLDRAEPEQVGDIASRLIERAATESRSLEEFQQKIRKYKTSQNGVMPNPERDPAKAMGYLSWLEDSSPGAGVDANVRYESNKRMAAFRKAAIAQGSGVY